ncbi:MAG: hypothetical protein K0R50_1652 [Eubacterium sp.]|nr:hypothetical protein [Eubacterium sp.]
MKIKSFWVKILIILFPVIAGGLVYFFRHELYYIGTLFPACPSYTYLHFLCPGCGNTRSVQHLLTGDIAESVRYNPVPLFGIIVGLLGYVELVAIVLNKPVIVIPRSKLFWKLIIFIFIFYFIIRNFIDIF